MRAALAPQPEISSEDVLSRASLKILPFDLEAVEAIVREEDRRGFFFDSPPNCGCPLWLSHFLANESEDKVSAISSSLSGQPLIDLGAGPLQRLHRFAAYVGAPSYVTVDKYYDLSPSAKMMNQDLKTPEATHIKQDMLLFLCQQVEGSANITMNAIGHKMIVTEAYRTRLAFEIARVIPSGGYFLSSKSIVEAYLSPKCFRELEPEESGISAEDFEQTGMAVFLRL